MPLYEYLCEKCRQVSEVIQGFSDEPLRSCPREGCGGSVSKQVSLGSFSLKGTGWYTTDYKRSAKSGASALSSEGASGGGSTSAATGAATGSAKSEVPTVTAKKD